MHNIASCIILHHAYIKYKISSLWLIGIAIVDYDISHKHNMYICVFDSTKAMGDRDTLFSTKLNNPCVGDKRFDMVSEMFPGKCVGLERRLDMMSGRFRLMVYVGMDRRLDTMSDRFQLMRKKENEKNKKKFNFL